jgi:hypothetical protein
LTDCNKPVARGEATSEFLVDGSLYTIASSTVISKQRPSAASMQGTRARAQARSELTILLTSHTATEELGRHPAKGRFDVRDRTVAMAETGFSAPAESRFAPLWIIIYIIQLF